MKIAIFGSKHQKKSQVEKLFEILKRNNTEIYLQEKFCNYLKDVQHLDYEIEGIIKDNDFDADLVVSIGGDGTFLRATSVIGKKNIPILGINAGRLGFLADVGEEDLEDTFADIFSCPERNSDSETGYGIDDYRTCSYQRGIPDVVRG